MTLTDGSRQWIEQELAPRYPGARVREPELRAVGTLTDCFYTGDRHVCTVTAHLEPSDPGYYAVMLTLTSDLAQRVNTVAVPELVPIYLKDTTIIE